MNSPPSRVRANICTKRLQWALQEGAPTAPREEWEFALKDEALSEG